MGGTSRVVSSWLTLAAITLCACGTRLALCQTPGAIPDPSTYEGSMQLQQQQDRQDQQFRQQQQQNSAPASGVPAQPGVAAPSGGGSGVDPRQIWERRPLVPPDRNPLIGRWNTHAAATVGPKTSPLGDIGSVFGADVAQMASGMLQSVCDSMFGSGIVDFRPNSLVSIGPNGSEKLLTRVEYRGGGARIAVLPLDPGAFGVAVFGFNGRDRITAEEIGCAMARANTVSTVRAVPASMQSVAPGTPAAVLSIATPLRGANVLILRHSINVALANGGLRASSNGTPMKTWHIACAMRTPVCQQGLQAVTADTVGVAKTDAVGRGQTPPLPVGHYFVFGDVQFANRPMIWNLPVELKAGANSVTLDQHNLTPIE